MDKIWYKVASKDSSHEVSAESLEAPFHNLKKNITPRAKRQALRGGCVILWAEESHFKRKEPKQTMPTTNDHDPRDRARFLCDTAGSVLSIHVRGEIDHHTASEIRRGIDGVLFEKRPHKLILDLSAVSFMDSSGLGLIMGRYAVMKELDGEMVR